MNGTAVACVGMVPAHYMRRAHAAIEARFGSLVRFLYVPLPGETAAERRYEQGEFPSTAIFVSREAAAVRRELARLNPHTVQVFGHRPAPLLHAAMWAKWNRRRVAYFSDGNLLDLAGEPCWKLAARKAVLGRALRAVDVFLPIGQQNRAYYRWLCGAGYEGAPSVFFPYPHDPSAFTANEAAGAQVRAELGCGNRLLVLSLGRLAEVKALDRLVEAVALMPQAHRDRVQLVIAGEGPMRPSLGSLASRLGVAANIVFPGQIRSDQAPAYFAACDVFVLPSQREPWGLVVNEAMSSGKPVIAPYWVGAAEMIHDGVNGFLANDNSPAELARQIGRALDAGPALAAMGQRARAEVVRGGWTVESTLRAMEWLVSGAVRASEASGR